MGKTRFPESRRWQSTTARWFYVVFGGCVAYSLLRYHIAGDVALVLVVVYLVPIVVKRNLVYERRKKQTRS